MHDPMDTPRTRPSGTPGRGLRLIGRVASSLTHRDPPDDALPPALPVGPAPVRRPASSLCWYQVGSSHITSTPDGYFEVRCVRDLRWEAVFVQSGSRPLLVEGQGTIFRSFDEALTAVEAFHRSRRRRRRAGPQGR